jgi:T-lymphoma invasion and metastasis-inducing protein 1
LVLGIIKGDEIMVINGAIVSDLDMMFIESVLQEELSLCMMMRSARTGSKISFYVEAKP